MLAAAVCGTSGGAVAFVDEHRSDVRASVGASALPAGADGPPGHDALSAATVAAPDGVLVISDTGADSGTRRGPVVSRPPSIGFYAGAVLTVGGRRVGTICAFASKPRELAAGQRAALVALAHLVSAQLELRRQAVELRELAVTDPLTGLANRRLLAATLTQVVGEDHGMVGLLSCDLDGFKVVNDRFGHDVGDRLLCHIAGRLRACVGPEDLVARVSGDEFVILCPRLPDPAALGAVAERVRSIACVTSPPRPCTVRISVGAVLAAHGDSPEDLLRRADALMYEEKRRSLAERVSWPILPPVGLPELELAG